MRYIFISIYFANYIICAIFAQEKEHKRYNQYESNKRNNSKCDSRKHRGC